MTSVLIVGGGLAGARCAETLRAGGFDGTLVLAGGESHAPYERPALSKELLSGARDAASLDAPGRAPRGRRPASPCDSARRSFASTCNAGAHSPARAQRWRTTYSWSRPALGRGGIRCCRACLASTTCARSTTRRACGTGSSPGRVSRSWAQA